MPSRRWPAVQVILWTTIAIMSIGMIGFAIATGTPLRFGDERQYVEIATNVANGDGFTLYGAPTAYRPPAWPLILALALFLGLPASLLSLLSAASLVGAAVLAALLGTKLCQSRWGTLAGIAILAYPLNIYTATTVYPQSFATLLVMAMWLAVSHLIDSPATPKRHNAALYLLVGFAASLLALSVPVLAFTGVVVVIAIVIVKRGDRIRAATISLAALVMPIAAWAIRNLVVLGHAIPISTSTGVNLLIGNNAEATGSSGLAVDIEAARQAAAAFADEFDRDAYLRSQALNWVFEHPADAVELYLAKVANYFSPYNEPITASAGSNAQQVIAYLSFVVVIVLVAMRFLGRSRTTLLSSEWLFLILFFANAPVMAVFFTRVRFRQPLDAILLVEAAIAVALIVARRIACNDRGGTDDRSFQTQGRHREK